MGLEALVSEAFADRSKYEKEAVLHEPGRLPFCANCVEKPGPPYGIDSVRSDIRMLDPQRVVPDSLAQKLTAWA